MRFLLFLLLFAGSVFSSPSWADIADDSPGFFHSPPAGLSRADRLFALDLTELDEEFGLDTLVFARYIPAADIPLREENSRAIPSWYVHVTYDRKYARYRLNEIVFGLATRFLGRVLSSQYDKPEFLRKLETLIGGALHRKMRIEAMTQSGFIERNSGIHSLLAYGHGVVESDDGGTENFMMANMTTFYLARGRFITLVQGCRIASEDELPAFTQRALQMAKKIAEVDSGMTEER